MSVIAGRAGAQALDVLRSSPPVRIFLALNVLALGLIMPQPLRALIVLPLLLFLPGYAVLAAVGLTSRRDHVLIVGMSVALSVAIIPLVTLALWAASGEVEPAYVAIVLAMIVLAPAVVGLQPLVNRRASGQRAAGAGGAVRVLLVLTIGVLLVAGLVAVLPGSPRAPFTQVSLAGGWADLDDAVVIAPDQPVAVDVEVTNRTGKPQTYHVEPSLEGGTWSDATVELGPGQTWNGTVEGTVPAGGCLHQLRVGVRADGSSSSLQGPTVWFQTADPLPRTCDVGTGR